MSASVTSQSESAGCQPAGEQPMDPTEGCHVAVLTPAGRGAVATICIVGPQAAAHVTAHFRPAAGRPLDAFPTGRVVFGRWSPAGTAGEEVVVCRRTDDVVEIHCHGGRFAAGTIVDSLVASGARAVSWQEFGARHETGGLEAEARVALAAARTERAAALLLDQWRGALRASLTQAVACIECGQTSRGEGILSELERWAVVGLHLVDPWRVVLTGRPNVGKSSLINAILGFERCIVHAAPGTTRDVVTAHTALDGWLAELADTAGWRDSGDEIETAGLQRARQQLRQADLVVLVFDHSAGWTAEDDALLAAWPGAVIVHNKCDLPPARSEGRPPGLRVSAPEGTGLDTLVRELAHRLVPATPPPGTAIVFSRRQREAVQCALSDLACGRGPEAAAALQELLATGGRDDAARGTVGFV